MDILNTMMEVYFQGCVTYIDGLGPRGLGFNKIIPFIAIPFINPRNPNHPAPNHQSIISWKNIKIMVDTMILCPCHSLSFPKYSWHVMVWQIDKMVWQFGKKSLKMRQQASAEAATSCSSQMLMFSLSAARLWPLTMARFHAQGGFWLRVDCGCKFATGEKSRLLVKLPPPNVWANGTHHDPICQVVLAEHQITRKKLWQTTDFSSQPIAGCRFQIVSSFFSAVEKSLPTSALHKGIWHTSKFKFYIIYIHICIYIYINIYTYVYTYIIIYIYLHVYIHI